MAKSGLLVVIVLAIIAGGVYIAQKRDPEQADRQLVSQALNHAIPYLQAQERQYLVSQRLNAKPQTHYLDYPGKNQVAAKLKLTLNSNTGNVELRFGQGQSLLASQTLIIEPLITDNQVKWKCLNGSVLLRLRPKHCRLGQAVETSRLAASGLF